MTGGPFVLVAPRHWNDVLRFERLADRQEVVVRVRRRQPLFVKDPFVIERSYYLQLIADSVGYAVKTGALAGYRQDALIPGVLLIRVVQRQKQPGACQHAGKAWPGIIVHHIRSGARVKRCLENIAHVGLRFTRDMVLRMCLIELDNDLIDTHGIFTELVPHENLFFLNGRFARSVVSAGIGPGSHAGYSKYAGR